MTNKQRLTSTIFLLHLFSVLIYAQPAQNPQTFCNPLNLNYRFMNEAVDAREAADPVIVLFKGDYYLFASHSGGYWTSPNLRDWTLIVPTGIDIETYAPGVLVMRDSLFYIPSATSQIYKTGDPKSGVWTTGATAKTYGDPAFFLDDDGRLYMYYGLAQNLPTSVVELDPITFSEIGSPINVVFPQPSIRGWERRGDNNLQDELPWIEGTWMVKENNKYYLHYAAPGTEFKTYADGIYISDSPMGPFQYASYSPFSLKSTGFITGGGHGSTFKDKDGNYWRIVTAVISVKNIFERRLSLFPVGFDGDGQIRTNTVFGDYPQYFPGIKSNPVDENFAGMMLLSYKKYVQASSSIEDHEIEKAVDEESRTYWSAQTGAAGEWMMIDLGNQCDVQAIQVNFGEHNIDMPSVRGRTNPVYEQYTIEVSDDGLTWNMLIDKSTNTADVPHDYIELAQTVNTRYIKLTNVFTPGNGKFAVRDLRIFGNSAQTVFTPASNINVQRDADGRNAVISWDPVAQADGYIMKYGIAANKLYNHYMVYDADSISIHSLNNGVEYFFSVEAFDNGTDIYVPEGEIRSRKSGNWNDSDTWETFSGTSWIPASHYPALTDAPVRIQNGHTINLTSSDSIDQFTIEAGGTLIVNQGTTLLVKNGVGNDLTVAGTLINFGSVNTDGIAAISFMNDGIYRHSQNGGSIPTATWWANSTCIIDSVKSTAPSNGNQNFHNITWNCPGQTSNLNMGWNGNTINGDISIVNTGTARWQMCAPAADASASVTINGDVVQTGGQFTSNGTSNAGTHITIYHNGNINVSGGNFSVSRGSQGGTGTTIWNFKGGSFSISNATTQNSNSSGAKFVFDGEGEIQDLSVSNVTYGGGGLPIEVNTGAILNLGISILGGSGSFNLKQDATLQTAHKSGLDSLIVTSGLVTLSKDANYSFNGTEAQVTGSLLPDTVGGITINNSAGLTLSKSIKVNRYLEMIKGSLATGSFNLNYGPNAALIYAGTSNQNTSDSEFPASGGPKNLILRTTRNVTLHAARTIPGKLELNGKLLLGANSFASDSIWNASLQAYVVTNGTGVLKSFVGSEQSFFPVGTTSSYAPVWISNLGTPDTLGVGVKSDATAAPFGGRIRAKWNIMKLSGTGAATIQFGWVTALEDAAFRNNRLAHARIFNLTDTAEVGTGNYTTQFIIQPYNVSRSGISFPDSFAIGSFSPVTDVVEEASVIVSEFRLSQNYPNPFNPTTKINYSVPRSSYITLKVYNLLGQEVTTLFEGFKQMGIYTAIIDGSGLASGVYLYRLTAENFVDTKKTILLK